MFEIKLLKVLDQAGVDQHTIEMPRFGAVGAAIEQAIAADQDFLLFGKGWIEQQASGAVPTL